MVAEFYYDSKFSKIFLRTSKTNFSSILPKYSQIWYRAILADYPRQNTESFFKNNTRLEDIWVGEFCLLCFGIVVE